MLGTTLFFIGIAGLVSKFLLMCSDYADPAVKLRARVAKTRLDTKKSNGEETYKYIITFFLYEHHYYISLEVEQEHFDVIMEKDDGILRCHLKRKKFIHWLFTNHSSNS
ncbi:MAG: hypothetical protein FWB80_06555 [Defluviitaleaceae bacterium]|nr:hypothetical protein [Defluviitaleaceae bacterium]